MNESITAFIAEQIRGDFCLDEQPADTKPQKLENVIDASSSQVIRQVYLRIGVSGSGCYKKREQLVGRAIRKGGSARIPKSSNIDSSNVTGMRWEDD